MSIAYGNTTTGGSSQLLFPVAVIGEGSFGLVWEVQADDGRRMAMKLPTRSNQGIDASTIAEIAALRLLERTACPFVVHLEAFLFDLVTTVGSNIAGALALLFPKYENSLAQLFPPSGPGLGTNRWTAVVVPLLRALVHLHTFVPPIVHLDINPNNILMSSSKEALLGDFGCSRVLSNSPTGMIGTPLYAAPEIEKNEAYDEKVDIWSLGIVVMEVSGGMRLPTRRPATVRALVDRRRQTLTDRTPPQHGAGMAPALLRQMLQPTSLLRCSAVEALHLALPDEMLIESSHPFKNDESSLGLQQMRLSQDVVNMLHDETMPSLPFFLATFQHIDSSVNNINRDDDACRIAMVFAALLAAKLLMGSGRSSVWDKALERGIVTKEDLSSYCVWETEAIKSLNGDLYPPLVV